MKSAYTSWKRKGKLIMIGDVDIFDEPSASSAKPASSNAKAVLSFDNIDFVCVIFVVV